MNILTQATPTALWFQIVHDAETACALSLEPEIKSYLVFLLMRYIQQTHFVSQAIAPLFLTSMNASPAERSCALQMVGDQCLLISGLYPNVAYKRRVTLDYFVKIGQSAYLFSSVEKNDVYTHLGQQFISLMDVLLAIRPSHTLLPLDVYQLWSETGSQYAFSVLKQYTHALPVLFHK